MTTRNPHLSPEQRELAEAARLAEEREKRERLRNPEHRRQTRQQEDLSKPPSDGTAHGHEFDWSW